MELGKNLKTTNPFGRLRSEMIKETPVSFFIFNKISKLIWDNVEINNTFVRL